jgi:hypothetical protein
LHAPERVILVLESAANSTFGVWKPKLEARNAVVLLGFSGHDATFSLM